MPYGFRNWMTCVVFVAMIGVQCTAAAAQPSTQSASIADVRKMISEDDLSGLRKAIAEGLDLNTADVNGWSLLQHAAVANNAEIANMLLKHGARLDTVSAAGLGLTDAVQDMVNADEDETEVRLGEWTPLTLALANGHAETALALLELGANRSSRGPHGSTPLHWAAHSGLVRIVQRLAESRDAVNSRDDFGATPLHFAARQGHEAVVRALLASKADSRAVTDGGATALVWAAIGGHLGVCKILAPESPPEMLNDALLAAVSTNRPTVAKALLDCGADPNARRSDGLAPLHLAAQRGSNAIVQLLLGMKAVVDARDDDGKTPLHHAAREGHLAAIDALLDAGASADARDENGWSPAELARIHKHEEAEKRLMKAVQDQRLAFGWRRALESEGSGV